MYIAGFKSSFYTQSSVVQLVLQLIERIDLIFGFWT